MIDQPHPGIVLSSVLGCHDRPSIAPLRGQRRAAMRSGGLTVRGIEIVSVFEREPDRMLTRWRSLATLPGIAPLRPHGDCPSNNAARARNACPIPLSNGLLSGSARKWLHRTFPWRTADQDRCRHRCRAWVRPADPYRRADRRRARSPWMTAPRSAGATPNAGRACHGNAIRAEVGACGRTSRPGSSARPASPQVPEPQGSAAPVNLMQRPRRTARRHCAMDGVPSCPKRTTA